MPGRKILCKRGHPRTLANVYKSGHCKACTIAKSNVYRGKSDRRKVYEQNYWLKRKYGLSKQDYNRRFSDQQGKCLICLESNHKLVVDHSHKTGKIRGLLCSHCNSLLGFAHDSPERLQSAIRYLSYR